MRSLILVFGLLLFASCAPSASNPTETGQLVVDEQTAYTGLVAPFEVDLRQLGIVVTNYDAYYYGGSDPNAFIEATNIFYQSNPGFCPIQNAFYAAANGLQFMTLASNGGTQIRGFLYNQSRRPRLTYAYFEGTSATTVLTSPCETAPTQ